MRDTFADALEKRVLVCDGAMGTQLYAKGIFLNRCFDELNLSRPDLIREIHLEYLWAGADILETNTFGANPIKLEPHGLADRIREINIAGVRIAREVAGESAFVAGSVGPLGIRVEPYGRLGSEEARRLFAEQIEALLEGGVDLLSLETFYDLNELHAALQACREVCALPVMAQVTLEEDGNSLDGTPPEEFGLRLAEWGADLVGVNCSVGPQVMLESIERISSTVSGKLVAQPNAGKPRNFEGRNLYLSSPKYFASYARRFIRAGVRVVGGCCGTTPAHIRAVRDEVLSLQPEPRPRVSLRARADVSSDSPQVQGPHGSVLERNLLKKQPITVVAMTSPRGSDPRAALQQVHTLEERGIEAIRIMDATPGSASMGALALAALIARELRIEPILQYVCAGKSLLTMQSELLGAHALGLRNLLLTNGEPLRVGDYLDATAADVDSIGVTHLVSGMNAGRDLGGKPFGHRSEWLTGFLLDPSAPDLDAEVRRAEYAAEAGARFFVTRPVFGAAALESFLRRTSHCRLPVVAGMKVLTSISEAEYLLNEVPGSLIPRDIVERLRGAAGPEEERGRGIQLALELKGQIAGMVQGIEILLDGEDIQLAAEVMMSAAT